MSNDTGDELCNALFHLNRARELELAIVPRYPRARARPGVLGPLIEAIAQAEAALAADELSVDPEISAG